MVWLSEGPVLEETGRKNTTTPAKPTTASNRKAAIKSSPFAGLDPPNAHPCEWFEFSSNHIRVLSLSVEEFLAL